MIYSQHKLISEYFIVALLFVSCTLTGDGSYILIKDSINPGKSKRAVLWENEGNATVAFSLQTSILLSNSNSLNGNEKGNVFIVDDDHGATSLKPSSVNFQWINDDTLLIDYDKKMRIFHQVKSIFGVTVLYKSR